MHLNDDFAPRRGPREGSVPYKCVRTHLRVRVGCAPRQASPHDQGEFQHMRSYFVVLAAAAVAALLVSSAASAAGGGPRVIRFLEVDKSRGDIFVDTDHNNRGSTGDIFMGSFGLHAWAKGGGRAAHRARQGHVHVSGREQRVLYGHVLHPRRLGCWGGLHPFLQRPVHDPSGRRDGGVRRCAWDVHFEKHQG